MSACEESGIHYCDATDFPCCIQIRNRLIVGIEYFRVPIDHESADCIIQLIAVVKEARVMLNSCRRSY